MAHRRVALWPERKEQLRSQLKVNLTGRNANNVVLVGGAYDAIFMP